MAFWSDRRINTPSRKPVVNYKTWTRDNGEVVRIKDMNDYHLVAAINKITTEAAQEAYRQLRNGNANFNPATALSNNALYNDLKFEAQVRGIEL